MKKKILTALALTGIFAFSACTKTEAPAPAAASNTRSESDFEDISAKGKMVIGITIYEPMNYYDENHHW